MEPNPRAWGSNKYRAIRKSPTCSTGLRAAPQAASQGFGKGDGAGCFPSGMLCQGLSSAFDPHQQDTKLPSPKKSSKGTSPHRRTQSQHRTGPLSSKAGHPTPRASYATAMPPSVPCQGFVLASVQHCRAAAFTTSLMMLSLP